ncbi:hypothetical protein V1477_016001 [Vespula maculifrons]|uniref:Uncharacterized protein n=1 Tax=Vespula maculifrons TaxID=7453 RepID=A0ABD2BBS1_VESMC
MCMDVQANEKKEKMNDRIVDEDVQIVEARVTRGKYLHFEVMGGGSTGASSDSSSDHKLNTAVVRRNSVDELDRFTVGSRTEPIA